MYISMHIQNKLAVNNTKEYNLTEQRNLFYFDYRIHSNYSNIYIRVELLSGKIRPMTKMCIKRRELSARICRTIVII